MKIPNRILSAILSIAMLIPTAATTISAVSPDAIPSAVAEVTDISVVFDVTPVYEIGGDSHIKLQFNTAISASEIEKVKITGLSSGEALNGKWQGAAQQWEFIPYDIQDATYYMVVVPADLFAENGLQMNEAATHTFRTAPGTTENAVDVVSIVSEFDCVKRGVGNSAAGYTLNQATYNLLKHTGEAFQIDTRAITSTVAPNPNVRISIFDDIFADRSYIGKTVRFSFEAMATQNGNIGLTLNQRVKYAFTNFPGLSATANLTTNWQTFVFEFTVTEDMYDIIIEDGGNTEDANRIQQPLALGVRFTDFSTNNVYDAAQLLFRNFVVVATESENDITNTDPILVAFENNNYSAANKINLRFAVDNAANATVGIYAATHTTLGSLLGTVDVNGAGIYSFDVTDYVKNCSGAPIFALKVEGSGATVDLASTLPMLSIITADTYDVLPTVSSSVVSTNPGGTQSGLWISGGQSATDSNNSAKSYIKLSLAGYTGGYAGFLFNAMSEGAATVSVYGVADVNAGQSWTPDSLTLTNAPANDVYGSGVNINEVYGNASLATFRVGAYDDTYRVDLTEFSEYMLSKGATEITLIIVTDSENVTNLEIVDTVDASIIATYNCVTSKPDNTAAGYTINSAYKLLSFTSEGFQIDTRAAAKKSGNFNDPNVRIYIFNEIWKDESYVGKTIRFTFSAKATRDKAISLSLTQNGGAGKYVWGEGFKLISESTQLSTSWQTYLFEFTVTQAMYDLVKNGEINAPGLALGVRFTDFSDDGKEYNGDQITFRNFTVSTSDNVIVEPIYYKHYDFDTKRPSSMNSMGYNLFDDNDTLNPKPSAKVINKELQINLNSNVKVQSNPYIQISAFNEVFADNTYVGKTFTISFRAKASEAGVMDIALNKWRTWETYSDSERTYNGQCELTTEYQTFSYTFIVTEDMVKTHNTPNPNIANECYNLNLALRFHNGFKNTTAVNDNGDYAYKDATIYIDDIIVVSYDEQAAQVATVAEEPVMPLAEESYDRIFDGVMYDFSTNRPVDKTLGYSVQIGNVVNGEYVVDLSKQTNAPNADQVAFIEALGSILSNSAHIGKTFTVSFRARATEAGALDFAINVNNKFDVFDNCTMQYDLGTQYRTFTYTFTLTQAMYNQDLVCGFRFYNGFKNGNTYKNAKIYIDDIRVYQDFLIDKTTLPVSNSSAVSNTGVSDKLTVSANTSTASAAISKSYLAYDLTTLTGITKALLKLNLSGANGDTVRVYLLKGATLPANLTYDNAPQPIGAAVLSFTAVNGENILDLTNLVIENEGTSIVLIFAIEHYSGNVQITNADLDITVNTHDYTSEEQRHVAVAPTYNAPGNIEFYTCAGCEKLYVKNGENFVEVDSDSVILPPVEYKTEISSISLNIGKDLTMRYHVVLTAGEDIDDFSLNFTLEGKPTVTVTEYTYDANTGKYIFSFTGIAPQLMGDTISSELVKNGQVIDRGDYSVKQYVIDALALYADDESLKQLLADLMYYGAAAQKYIGYKVDDLVTDGLNLNSASTATPTEADKNKSVSAATNSDVQFTAAGVRFDSNNRIYVKFKAPGIDGVKVSVGGVDLEIQETNQAGIYIAYSDAISALHFAEKVTFTLSYNGVTVQTLVYTINDYALAKHSNSNIAELALALYRYGKSAVAYDNNK